MPHIGVTHTTGFLRMTLTRRQRITPHMIRLTFTGPELAQFVSKGFDQWFRLAIPVRPHTRFDNLPEKFSMGGYVSFLRLPKETRPVIRNYTVREFRTDPYEMDVDFLAHDEGIAGPWAASAEIGTEVAFIDQGCGWNPVPAPWHLILADESGLPAAAGILRDMPRDSHGCALIEIPDAADQQEVEPPEGMEVQWVVREPGALPGSAVLPALAQVEIPTPDIYAFTVGEAKVATGARRFLVKERGIDKSRVTFSGYWRVGKAAPSS